MGIYSFRSKILTKCHLSEIIYEYAFILNSILSKSSFNVELEFLKNSSFTNLFLISLI